MSTFECNCKDDGGSVAGAGSGAIRVNLLPQYFGLRNDWRIERGSSEPMGVDLFVQIVVLFGKRMCIDVKEQRSVNSI